MKSIFYQAARKDRVLICFGLAVLCLFAFMGDACAVNENAIKQVMELSKSISGTSESIIPRASVLAGVVLLVFGLATTRLKVAGFGIATAVLPQILYSVTSTGITVLVP